MRLISFSLWGTSPRYLVGALRNAELAARIYPGWRVRFYCGASVPQDVVARLRSFAHVDIVAMPEAGDWRGLFWRFYPASDGDVSVMLSRDADSRINQRERAAVEEWLRSEKDFHTMRDHPYHDLPIQGGMWGVRNGLLRNMRELIERFPKSDRWQIDQRFLNSAIAPRVRDRWLEHDEYYARKPFPTAAQGSEFVGQPFDEFDRADLPRPSRRQVRLLRVLQSVRRCASTVRGLTTFTRRAASIRSHRM